MANTNRPTARRPAANAKPSGAITDYREGMARAQQETKRQEERRAERQATAGVFRFYLKDGETREVAILDDQPQYFRYEHNYQDGEGKFKNYCGCVRDRGHCPACEALGKEGYYAMYLTILDLTPYEDKDGNEVGFSRKLLCIKTKMIGIWQRRIDKALDQYGTLRGLVFQLTRTDSNASSTGDDIQCMDETIDMNADYTRQWTDREKKVHTEDQAEPFDYDKIFPVTTEASLRAIFGGRPAPGSREANEAALAEDELPPDDEAPWVDTDAAVAEEEAPAPSRARPGTRGAAAPAARNAPAARSAPAAAPSRSRTPAAAAPAAPTRTRTPPTPATTGNRPAARRRTP